MENVRRLSTQPWDHRDIYSEDSEMLSLDENESIPNDVEQPDEKPSDKASVQIQESSEKSLSVTKAHPVWDNIGSMNEHQSDSQIHDTESKGVNTSILEEDWICFHQNIAFMKKSVKESDIDPFLRRLLLEDFNTHLKNAEQHILAHQFPRMAKNHLLRETSTTLRFRECVEAGLKNLESLTGASPEKPPKLGVLIEHESVLNVKKVIEIGLNADLLQEQTRRVIHLQKEEKQFIQDMTKFQNEARQLPCSSYSEFPEFFRSFQFEKTLLEYSMELTKVDGIYTEEQEK